MFVRVEGSEGKAKKDIGGNMVREDAHIPNRHNVRL